jgi:AraC-like DNA-binding protein
MHASELLQSQGDKAVILDIAMRSGFGSLASFNRTFKDVTGQSPREFRAAQITQKAIKS